MWNRLTRVAPWWALVAFVFTLLLGKAAQACPSYYQLKAANNYGCVTPTLLSTYGGKYTYGFTVKNTQGAGGWGIKGLIVYGSTAPVAISCSSNLNSTLYVSSVQGSEWEIRSGGSDYNRNGLGDSYIEPGKTSANNTFTLTYSRAIDTSSLKFGLQLVKPWGCDVCWVRAESCAPQSKACVEVSATSDKDCVVSGSYVTFSYKIKNAGSSTLKSFNIVDNEGCLYGAPSTLAPGASFTLTRKVCIRNSSCYDEYCMDVKVTACDTSGASCSDEAETCVDIVTPSLDVCIDAPSCVVAPPGTAAVKFTVKNTGNVTVNNIQAGISINGGAWQVVKTIGTLAPCGYTTFTYTVTGLTRDSYISGGVLGQDACSNTDVSDCDTDCVSVIKPAIDVSCTSHSPSCVAPGGSTTITYVVRNTGDQRLSNITVTAKVNGGSTLTIGTVYCLDPGQSKTFYYKFNNIQSNTTIVVTATGKEGCNCSNVTATETCTVSVCQPSLQASGTPICMTPGTTGSTVFTIKNTGDVAISNLTAGTPTSNTGATQILVGALGATTLAPGASTTVTVNLVAPSVAGTITLPVSGKYGTALTTISTTGTAAANVISPSFSLKLNSLVGPFQPGQPFTVTGTYKNTGDVDLEEVILTVTGLPGIGSDTLEIGTLAKNSGDKTFSVQLTLPTTFPAGRQFTVGAVIEGRACQQTAAADDQTVGRSDAPPTFTISGRAICGPAPTFTDPTLVGFTDTPGYALEGVLVQLLGTGQPTPPSTLTNAAGEFSFSVPAGTYQVRLTALEREITDTASITVGPDQALGDIPVSPLKVCYTAVQATSGRMYFSTTWNGLPAVGAPVLTAADLTNTAYTCPPTGPFRYYQYTGEIPGFPELGTFDLDTKKIWLVMYSPLAAEDRWVGTSFTNLVGVRGVVVPGVAGSGSNNSYVIRTTLNQPFECAGTAFNYTVTSASITPAPAVAAKVTRLPSVRTDGTAGTQPTDGTVPQGWMARTQLEWIWPSGVSGQFFANGSYTNVCGDVYQFSICPDEKTPSNAKKR